MNGLRQHGKGENLSRGRGWTEREGGGGGGGRAVKAWKFRCVLVFYASIT